MTQLSLRLGRASQTSVISDYRNDGGLEPVREKFGYDTTMAVLMAPLITEQRNWTCFRDFCQVVKWFG